MENLLERIKEMEKRTYKAQRNIEKIGEYRNALDLADKWVEHLYDNSKEARFPETSVEKLALGKKLTYLARKTGDENFYGTAAAQLNIAYDTKNKFSNPDIDEINCMVHNTYTKLAESFLGENKYYGFDCFRKMREAGSQILKK